MTILLRKVLRRPTVPIHVNYVDVVHLIACQAEKLNTNYTQRTRFPYNPTHLICIHVPVSTPFALTVSVRQYEIAAFIVNLCGCMETLQ